jgi:hypothetical protein
MLGLRAFEFLHHFEPRRHVLFLYQDQEAKRELLFSHLRYANNNEGLAYVCSEESPQSVREKLNSFGVDECSFKGDRRLVVKNFDEVYIVDGEVMIPQIISKFTHLVNDFKAQGLLGMRAAGEMSCFLEQRKVEALVNYEFALQQKFDFDCEGICAYNIEQMAKLGYLDILMSLVKAHDPVIFSGDKGFLILESEKVRMKHVEMFLSETKTLTNN